MSAITLYGAAYSTCTQRVLITLHELGLDYRLQPIEMKEEEHKVCMRPQNSFGIAKGLSRRTSNISQNSTLSAGYPPCKTAI